jgi:hypothetical protein
MGDYPTRLSQAKYDALPAKAIQMAIDNRELRDEYLQPFRPFSLLSTFAFVCAGADSILSACVSFIKGSIAS